jgi:hypothetical protein
VPISCIYCTEKLHRSCCCYAQLEKFTTADLLDQAKEAIGLTQGWLVARASRALRGAAWPVPFWRSEGTAWCFRFALAETDSQAAKRVKKKKNKQPLIAEDQPRTSVPQLSLRRNVNPPGRGLLHHTVVGRLSHNLQCLC